MIGITTTANQEEMKMKETKIRELREQLENIGYDYSEDLRGRSILAVLNIAERNGVAVYWGCLLWVRPEDVF